MSDAEEVMKVTALEFKELLGVLLYYILSGLALGFAIAPIAVKGGIVLVRSSYGLPLSIQALTALIVILLGVLTALLGYIVLIPAELKIIRRRLTPILLAKRLSGKK
jgi:hypothetical protein